MKILSILAAAFVAAEAAKSDGGSVRGGVIDAISRRVLKADNKGSQGATPPPGQCVICSKANKVGNSFRDGGGFLLLEYDPIGKESPYQSGNDICGLDTYPTNPVLTLPNNSKLTVKAGDTFKIEGSFDTNSDFEFNGSNG